MSSTATFCAIMPNYNDAATLRAAIHSLAVQTVPFDRILVIDDGSTDNSMAILTELRQSVPALEVLENGTNRGVIATMNRGLEAACEDYVFFASANDVFADDALAHAKAALATSAGDVGLIGGKTRLAGRDGTLIIAAPLADIPATYAPQRYLDIVRQRNFSFYGCSAFLHRASCLAAGGFQPSLQWHTDWFLMALLCARHGFAYTPHVIGTMQLREGQYSQSIHEWRKQGPVIAAFIAALRHSAPEDYRNFRSIGLLPSYDIQALGLLLARGELRDYLTPLLVWRLLSYKTLRAAGRLLPRRLREKLRGIFRV